MNTRRFLAAMLAVVMLFALVPVTARAAEDDTVYESGKLYLDKTATLEDDGTYTIRMEAFATGTPVTTSVITGTPLDVVLVIDQSGSIYNDGYCDEIEDAVEAFINQLAENGKKIGKTHRVAVAGFACSEWETGVTQSLGVNTDPYEGNLPLADGSYAQLWTNTGIFLNDGTFKSYQTFEFEEVPPAEETLVRTNMTVGGYRGNYYSNNWFDIEGFFTADGEQIQAKVTRGGSFLNRTYSWQFQTKSGKTLTFNVTNKDETNASVNDQETYTKTEVGGLPAYSSSNDPYYVTYGTYTHPVNGGSSESRKFPLYFVDDTKTWSYTDEEGKEHLRTVRRAIYRHSDGKFYYDFRGYDRFTGTKLDSVEVDLTNKTVYKIKYDYNTETGEFNGGYLTAEDYQKTFMNVTDGVAGSGNVTEALKKISSGLGASGATRTGTGMEMARKILEHNPLTEADKEEGRERVVVVFTDGLPGQSPFEIEEANAAMVESAKIKDMDGTNEKVTVYALGLFKQNVVNAQKTDIFMNGLSSNYPDAVKMEDVSPYIRKDLTLPTSDRPTEWTTAEDYYVYVNGEMEPLQWRYSSSRWSFRSAITQTTMNFGSYNYNSTVVSGKETYTFGETYTETGNPHTKDGKFYSKTADIGELMSLFPTIVTESTSTSMHSVYLTEGSILRDIMSDALRMTGPVSIWTATQTGTWTSTNDAQTQGKIAWGAETLTGERRDFPNPSQAKGADNNGQNIQLYNTNPAADGNFYETASGEPNLTAPPTVDVTGFDYQQEFVAFDKTGRKLIVYISGVEAQPDKVAYDKNNATNHQQSGLWSPKDEEGNRELVGNFPMPNTTFTEALYVLDYAKPMTLNPADLKMSVVKSLDIDGMNGFKPAVTEITEGNGIVTVENGKYVYTPTTTAWNGYDTFYVFGNTTDAGVLGYSANDALDNLWGRVNVLPANNVYYEDSFIQSQNGVTVGIEYSGTWSTVDDMEKTKKEPNQNEENPESGEFNNGEDKPFGGVHGWEDYLQDDTGFSDGSAHKAELTDSSKTATATFTFTGTGVDIYSYTDLVQGAVLASIYAGDHVPTNEEMQADPAKRPLYSCIMDNFSLSDDYYQIPTLSLHEKNVQKTDENGNKVTVQEPLEYGTYTVKLTVLAKIDNADGDDTTVDEGRENGQTRRYTYHLDGIRIYNPIQNLEGDETVQQAYGEEELNASFVEVRDILLDQTNIDANGGMLGGVVFLDQVPNFNGNLDNEEEGTVGQPSDGEYPKPGAGVDEDGNPILYDEIGIYKDYGPKNEVYLASGQSIAFIPKEGLHYYVGLKSPTGETVCVSILKDDVAQLLKLDHTTDLYYEVTPVEGIVLIGNPGVEVYKDEQGNEIKNVYDNLLSVTKIKVTGPDGTEVETADFFEPADQPTVLRMVRTLREEAAAEPEIPEDTEPTEPTGPEVDIENPTEPSEPEVPGEDDKNHYDDLWKLIGGIFDLIRGIIIN